MYVGRLDKNTTTDAIRGHLLDIGIINEDISDVIKLNPFSPKIDFYVDLSICATSWASYHKFMLFSKIYQETYYLGQYITLSF